MADFRAVEEDQEDGRRVPMVVVARVWKRRAARELVAELNWATSTNSHQQPRYWTERSWVGWAIMKD
jgi:hypothetical protein